MQNDKPLTEAELHNLRNAKTEAQWNADCDAIKAARGGSYPSDWYAKVIQSGVLFAAQARFS